MAQSLTNEIIGLRISVFVMRLPGAGGFLFRTAKIVGLDEQDLAEAQLGPEIVLIAAETQGEESPSCSLRPVVGIVHPDVVANGGRAPGVKKKLDQRRLVESFNIETKVPFSSLPDLSFSETSPYPSMLD